MGAAFRPGNGVLVACTTTSGSTVVDMGTNADVVMIENAGSVPAFLAFSPTSAPVATVPTSTAAANNFVVGAGKTQLISVGGARYVAGITGSSTASVYVHTGSGE